MIRDDIDYRAAAEELEEIVWGAVANRTAVTSKLAGHWAGRVLGVALPEPDGKTMLIHPTAVIYPGVTLGENVWIGAYAVIGGPGEIRGEWSGEGHVTIGDGTVIRECVVIQGPASVGRDCYIMDGTHIAHDNRIGNRVTLSPHVAFAGHVTVEDDATVGMGVMVHQRRTIGAGAMVGMGAVVTKDIGPFEKWYGNPARQHGMNDRRLPPQGMTQDEWLSECYD